MLSPSFNVSGFVNTLSQAGKRCQSCYSVQAWCSCMPAEHKGWPRAEEREQHVSPWSCASQAWLWLRAAKGAAPAYSPGRAAQQISAPLCLHLSHVFLAFETHAAENILATSDQSWASLSSQSMTDPQTWWIHPDSSHFAAILDQLQANMGSMRVMGRIREIGGLHFSMVNISQCKLPFHVMWSYATSWPPQSDGDHILFWLFYSWSLFSCVWGCLRSWVTSTRIAAEPGRLEVGVWLHFRVKINLALINKA